MKTLEEIKDEVALEIIQASPTTPPITKPQPPKEDYIMKETLAKRFKRDGVVLDKHNCKIKICKFSDIRHIFAEYHYKKDAMGGGISICFAMFMGDDLVGGSVLGLPRHSKKYPNAIDIRRMACLDSSPFNSESWFLGQIIKYISRNTDYSFILSYSDKTVGHLGTIYKAANFKSVGTTSPTKYVVWGDRQYHPRSLSIDRPYSYRLREAVSIGEAQVITGEPKIIWIYTVNPKQRGKIFNVSGI